MLRLAVPLLLALAAVALLTWRKAPTGEDLSQRRLLMGTLVEISVPEAPPGADAAVNAAFAEMERIERLMSPHMEGSDLQRLGAGVPEAEASAETLEVLRLALEVQAQSGGAFDPALGRLIRLWAVETEEPRKPSPAEIRQALGPGGEGAVLILGERVRKADPELLLDLGGVAKGYAVDRAVEVLKSRGIAQAAVNAGGDIRVLGGRGERPWRIALQHPRDPDAVLGTLEIKDKAVVSSGDYERYFEIEGVRYHHLFDPRTGYPARLCRSVSVLAESAAYADALATAVFVLGPEKGMALVESLPGVEALVVDAGGGLHLSAGLEGKLH